MRNGDRRRSLPLFVCVVGSDVNGGGVVVHRTKPDLEFPHN